MGTVALRSKRGRQAIGIASVQACARLFLRIQISWSLLVASPMQGLTLHTHRVLASADPILGLTDFDRLQDVLSNSLGVERATLVLLGSMAALALVLIAVSLVVLGADIVAQRTQSLLGTVGHRTRQPGFPCLNDDLIGPLATLEKFSVVEANPRSTFLLSSFKSRSVVTAGSRTIAISNDRNKLFNDRRRFGAPRGARGQSAANESSTEETRRAEEIE